MKTKVINESLPPLGASEVAQRVPSHEAESRARRHIDATPRATPDQRAAKLYRAGPTAKPTKKRGGKL